MITRKITTFANVKGKKFRVVGNTAGHNYPMGKIFTFKKDNPIASGSDMALEFIGNSINAMDVELVYSASKEEVEKDLAVLKEEYEKRSQELNDILDYLKETGAEEMDYDEIKIYKALKTLDSKASIYDKTKMIAKLIKS